MIRIKHKLQGVASLIICLLGISYFSLYTVPEGRMALLLPNSLLSHSSSFQSVDSSGLHIKVPFFERVVSIDQRLHNVPQATANLLTEDKQSLLLSYYATWRITQPNHYYRATLNNLQTAQQSIRDTINHLLRSNAQTMQLTLLLKQSQTLLPNEIKIKANKLPQAQGITLSDIGVINIARPGAANKQIIDKTRLKLQQLALEQEQAAKTNADLLRLKADDQAALMVTKAKAQATQIRSAADAEAADIYQAAFQKNPAFANFLLSLDAYQKGFNASKKQNNLMILTQNVFSTLPLEQEHA